jgi:SPP1 gp7 family putative phage head morphogenesis protein
MTVFFASQTDDVAQQISAKLEYGISAEAAIEALSFKSWADLAEKLAGNPGDVTTDAPMAAIAKNGGEEALVQISIGEADTFSVVNAQAVEWAQARAAEMVGMKWVDGELIPNPNAIWQITESTRDMIKNVVLLAEQEGWGVEKLTKALIEDYAFSKARARMIARTEIAAADMAGSMIAYRASGVVTHKEWLTAAGCCEICEALDGVTVALDEEFPDGAGDAPPLHPNCRCSVLPITD